MILKNEMNTFEGFLLEELSSTLRETSSSKRKRFRFQHLYFLKDQISVRWPFGSGKFSSATAKKKIYKLLGCKLVLLKLGFNFQKWKNQVHKTLLIIGGNQKQTMKFCFFILVLLLKRGIMQCLVPNCLQCSALGPCLVCHPGYYKSGTQCIPCEVGCTECSASNVCSSCSPGYFLSGSICASNSYIKTGYKVYRLPCIMC